MLDELDEISNTIYWMLLFALMYVCSFPYLHEKYVSCSVCSRMDYKSLLLDVAAAAGSHRELPSILGKIT